jgi:hypothetical protein
MATTNGYTPGQLSAFNGPPQGAGPASTPTAVSQGSGWLPGEQGKPTTGQFNPSTGQYYGTAIPTGSTTPGYGDPAASAPQGGSVVYSTQPSSNYNTPGATATGPAYNGGTPGQNQGPNATTSGVAGNAGTYGTTNYQGEINPNLNQYTTVSAAPAALYNWNGPTSGQELAMQQAAMNQQAAQINPNVLNGGSQYMGNVNSGFAGAQNANSMIGQGAAQAMMASNEGYAGIGIANGQQGVGSQLESTLASEAQGNGPNPALAQAQQSQQNNLASQLAMAANARGAGQGTATYNAMQNAATGNAAINQQATIAREQQQLNASQELAGVQNNIANQGLGVSAAGAALGNLGLGAGNLGVQAGNMNLAAGSLGLQAQGQLEGQQYQLGAQNAGLQQQQNALSDQTGLGYNSNALSAGVNQLNAGIAEGSNIENAETSSGNLALGLQANNTSQNSTFLGGIGQVFGTGGNAPSGGGLNSDINSKQGISPAGANGGQFVSQTASTTTVPQRPAVVTGLQATGQNAGTQPAGAMAVPPYSMGLFSDPWLKTDVQPAGNNPQVSAQPGAQVQQDPAHVFTYTPQQGGGSGGLGSAMGTAATAAMGALVSDERTKQMIRPAGNTVSDDFLRSLTQSESTYTYRDPRNEPTDHPTGQRYLGVMAQALERSPTGDTLVKDGPKGKYLELGPLVSALAAGEGRLNERLHAVEDALQRAISIIMLQSSSPHQFSIGAR